MLDYGLIIQIHKNMTCLWNFIFLDFWLLLKHLDSQCVAQSISPTAPRAPSPSVTPGHTTTPKEGTGDILHLETPVGTARDQYGLLTAISPNYACPNNKSSETWCDQDQWQKLKEL